MVRCSCCRHPARVKVTLSDGNPHMFCEHCLEEAIYAAGSRPYDILEPKTSLKGYIEMLKLTKETEKDSGRRCKNGG